MRADSLIHNVFGHFQNLNLLMLLEDLRHGETARGDWLASGKLCPVAHGMQDGDIVRQLRFVSQADDLPRGCWHAANQLGADPIDIERFVTKWDSLGDLTGWLLTELEFLWQERLDDAETMQEILQHTSGNYRSELSARGSSKGRLVQYRQATPFSGHFYSTCE